MKTELNPKFIEGALTSMNNVVAGQLKEDDPIVDKLVEQVRGIDKSDDYKMTYKQFQAIEVVKRHQFYELDRALLYRGTKLFLRHYREIHKDYQVTDESFDLYKTEMTNRELLIMLIEQWDGALEPDIVVQSTTGDHYVVIPPELSSLFRVYDNYRDWGLNLQETRIMQRLEDSDIVEIDEYFFVLNNETNSSS